MIPMGKAVAFSVLLHSLAIIAMVWSTEFSIARFIENKDAIKLSGVVEVNLLYKPTETAMRKGTNSTELPPPQIKTRTPPPPKVKMPAPKPKAPPPPTPAKKPSPPQKNEKEDSKAKLDQKKQDMQALIAKMRQEQGLIAEKEPREDNFPTDEQGEKDGRGTGGSAQLQADPAYLALQTAIRNHFEMPGKEKFQRENPNAESLFRVRLVAVGNQFEIASLRIQRASGFQILDRSCELAIREALQKEVFSSDVLVQLTGKEEIFKCQP